MVSSCVTWLKIMLPQYYHTNRNITEKLQLVVLPAHRCARSTHKAPLYYRCVTTPENALTVEIYCVIFATVKLELIVRTFRQTLIFAKRFGPAGKSTW